MKKLFFLILFFSINIITFGANVYFLCDQGFICTDGQTFYSDQDGHALVPYHIWADPLRYYISEWGARFQDPDGNWSDWSHLSSGYGQHECLKAGTWHVQGRVFVTLDITTFQTNFYMYTSFTLCFNVVDNYAPSVPQNVSASWQSGHPRISWANNSQYDMGSYIIAKQVVDVSYWMDVATVSAGTTSWSDPYAFPSGKFDPVYTLQYKVKAKDINNNISGYSSVQTVYGQSSMLWKSASFFDKDITDYKLYANYPNPFNPTTQIAYQLLNDGFVKLIVYNTIGQEVAVLVNQYQEKGTYSVQFNAVNLPSGIYIYKLQTEGFSDIKKMILAK